MRSLVEGVKNVELNVLLELFERTELEFDFLVVFFTGLEALEHRLDVLLEDFVPDLAEVEVDPADVRLDTVSLLGLLESSLARLGNVDQRVEHVLSQHLQGLEDGVDLALHFQRDRQRSGSPTVVFRTQRRQSLGGFLKRGLVFRALKRVQSPFVGLIFH